MKLLLGERSYMSMMDIFEPLIETDTRQLLDISSNIFYAVDLIPTWVVKRCQDVAQLQL